MAVLEAPDDDPVKRGADQPPTQVEFEQAATATVLFDDSPLMRRPTVARPLFPYHQLWAASERVNFAPQPPESSAKNQDSGAA